MSIYQVKYRANNQTINTNIEADSLDNVFSFFRAVCVGEILQIAEYMTIENKFKVKKDYSASRYCSVSLFFKDGTIKKIKIPALKSNKNLSDIRGLMMSLYKNVNDVIVNYSSV